MADDVVVDEVVVDDVVTEVVEGAEHVLMLKQDRSYTGVPSDAA